ncbi:hypothetical protein N0V90_006060 [Kalmusia sp. IMI 367209]|nr:hypothetical protein N0V90_006060 [Kalmusia sp. IMI 367209]
MPLKYNDAIILTMFLVALVVVGLVWFCYRDCVRVVEAEAQHIELQQKAEEFKAKGGGEAGAANNNLAIAISLAALFGAAVLWAVVYYLHRWIHVKCLQLAHWFHVLPKPTPTPENHGQERATATESADEEREREIRKKELEEKEKRRREKARKKVEEWEDSDETHMSPGETLRQYRRERAAGSYSIDVDDELMPVGPRMRAQPYVPVVPVYLPLAQPYVPQYVPPLLQSAPRLPPSFGSPTDRGPIYPQAACRPTYSQPHVEKRVPSSIEYECEEAYEPSSHQTTAAHNQVDFIHICDDLPPLVREALEKHEKKTQPSSAETSSSSSASSSAEEIPRAHIPHATQRPPFHFPQHANMPARFWNPAPTSYPRQWMDGSEPGDLDHDSRDPIVSKIERKISALAPEEPSEPLRDVARVSSVRSEEDETNEVDSPSERRRILLGMSPSVSQNREGHVSMHAEEQATRVLAESQDEETGEQNTAQRDNVAPMRMEVEPQAHATSPSSLVSSLHTR